MKIGHESDQLPGDTEPPLVKGGQGRSAGDILTWAFLAGLVLAGILIMGWALA